MGYWSTDPSDRDSYLPYSPWSDVTTKSGTSCANHGTGDILGECKVSVRPPRSGDGRVSPGSSPNSGSSSLLGVTATGALSVRRTLGREL